MSDEKYIFSAGAKKNIFIVLAVGIVLAVLGVIMINSGGHHDAHGAEHAVEAAAAHGEHAAHGAEHTAEAAGEHHAAYHWTHRLKANLWINNLFFTGLAIIGVFFICIQYVAQAGWSVGVKRIPMAMASFLPIAAVLMIVVWLFSNHEIFHWTHAGLMDPDSPEFDPIIKGKEGYLNFGFYMGRMVAFFAIWYLLFIQIRKNMLAEDLEGGTNRWKKLVGLSAAFIVFFGYSSSIAAWDWVMSIDPHWFSTMFGWYVFASWWVTGLAFITFVAIQLKDKGYLSVVNSNHLHDLGKFVWGFSIFWTYIWFSQFLLIYYANIPEETIYFVERLKSDYYSKIFFINLIINFVLPFLLLMTRDSKRHARILKVVTPIVIFGHWLDFYLMVTPGVLKENGGFGFLEIGLMLVYGATFVYVMLHSLAKHPLVAKNHPMYNEALHHHI
ncbi:quinol:cytochrome C oxidoreductase [Reichenbachiella ulvae]|uniref:Quinol:cytochrome C oxidoreductase n=1 Tax=Reichenbachiella ulvae TaxID=2980104 RepID=A0ABT3CVF0_9BACT|nr:quinol:cytochrome C oxidoreductase [Reichenbachiella ulvae]MCV9387666.1 quinol:cytochrome C oxidoreductase [Reichenbachiella ulvae]